MHEVAFADSMDFVEGDQGEYKVGGGGYDGENEGGERGGIQDGLLAVVRRDGDYCVDQTEEGGEETWPVGSNVLAIVFHRSCSGGTHTKTTSIWNNQLLRNSVRAAAER